MKITELPPEAAIKEVQRIFKERGTKVFEIARRTVIEDKLESKKAQQALAYFMTEYWYDVARPSLMALACEAVGGKAKLTEPIAVPMILISGAIDIHDDIIDQSRSKDGRPTVYGRFGKDIALLVGDALLFKGFTLLNKVTDESIPAEKMSQISDIIKSMFFELGDAEALELKFRGRLDVNPTDYLHLVRMKAADVEAHTRISAILGNGSGKEIRALSEYGRLLGMMIILRDDLIDLMVPQECRSRVRKEILPLPLLYGLQDSGHGSKLRLMLQRKPFRNRESQEILEVVYSSKAIKRYRKTLEEIAAKAVLKLSALRTDTEELQLLVEAMLPAIEEGARVEG